MKHQLTPRRADGGRQSRLLVFAALLAFWVLLCIALAGCGGGGDDADGRSCLDQVDRITLADGRVVLAPNNCPPEPQ